MNTLIKICGYLIFLLLIITGCERRPLDADYNNGALVQFHINWDNMTQRPEYLKMIFYPVNGSSPVFRYLEDTDKPLIPVPYGSYYVILYNWRDNGDIQSVKYMNENDYATFSVYTETTSLSMFTDEIIAQPDSNLCTWSSSDISSLRNTRTPDVSSGEVITIGQQNNLVLAITPVPLVKKYSFFIPVNNQKYIKRAEAIVSGVSRYKDISKRQITGDSYNMSVSLSRATGGIRCRFSTFGCFPDKKHLFTLKLMLQDGSIMIRETDLTEEINNGMISDFTEPINITPSEDNSGGFTDPSIGEWENVSDDIPI